MANRHNPGALDDKFVRVSYLVLLVSDGTRAGGSGETRLYLSELMEWLAQRPGTMICSIEEL